MEISDETKKKVLEDLLSQLDRQEVDSIDQPEGEASEGEACPYCGHDSGEESEDCMMHGMNSDKEDSPPKKKSIPGLSIYSKK